MAIAAGMFDVLDKQVLQGMSSLWRESLHPLFQAIAELGGLELTTLLMLALAIFLLRRGFGADGWVVLVFLAAQVLEVLYKANLHHLGPPRTVAHADGPSITDLVSGSGPLANSFPSGHMVRAVIAYPDRDRDHRARRFRSPVPRRALGVGRAGRSAARRDRLAGRDHLA